MILHTIEMKTDFGDWTLYWSFRSKAARDNKLALLRGILPNRQFRANHGDAEKTRRRWVYPLSRNPSGTTRRVKNGGAEVPDAR